MRRGRLALRRRSPFSFWRSGPQGRQLVLPALFGYWGIRTSISVIETLRPSATVTNGSLWTYSTGVLADSWQLIDDDPDAPNETDYIAHGSTAVGQAWISDLTNPSGGFSAANTGTDKVRAKARYQIANYVSGTYRIRVRLTDSSDVAITDTVVIDQNQNIGPATAEVTLTLNANGLSKNTNADWATHRIRLDSDTGTGTATITIYSVEINLYDYT